MSRFQWVLGLTICGFTCVGFSQSLNISKYQKKPKLVVALVIDQFRADMLTRFQKKFIPAQSGGQLGGFNFLMEKGSYFPVAEYEIMQSMTCPGHATILTGAYPTHMGIPSNEWFDRQSKKMVYCAQDNEFGSSPHRLKGTTVGDELKQSYPTSKVFTVALKDRSAIMLGGKSANMAFWFDEKNFVWETSKYYSQGQLPAWVQTINKQLESIPTTPVQWMNKSYNLRTEAGLMTPKGVEMTIDFAISILQQEKLGKGSQPDLLAVSLSSHDFVGHAFGPNSAETENITLSEDQQVARLINAISKHLGNLDDVVITLTADHGIPPTVEYAQKMKLYSGQIDQLALHRKINEALDKKFGSSGKDSWIEGGRLFHFYLNQKVIADKKLSSEDVEAEVRNLLTAEPGFFSAFTRFDYMKKNLPSGFLGQQILNTYIPEIAGDIVGIPLPLWSTKGDSLISHMTGYAYDRTVPLVIFSKMSQPGVYPQASKVVDLAPTLSFILGVMPPSQNSGRVLKEIFIK